MFVAQERSLSWSYIFMTLQLRSTTTNCSEFTWVQNLQREANNGRRKYIGSTQGGRMIS